MYKEKEISLIIGSIYKDFCHLTNLLKKLDNNINYLKEIICVISGVNSSNEKEISNILKNIIKIKLEIVFKEEIVMPGEARNIGIQKSNCDYVCFLDSYTFPNKDWLNESINIMEQKKMRGVLGRTKYLPLNEIDQCFISATYGNRPLFTVPGTLIEKSLLKEIGFFIPNTRSGEDSEWINRSKLFQENIKQVNVIPLNYIGLKGMNFFELCSKWYEYYKSSFLVPKLVMQRFFYLSLLAIFSVLIAFSWNDKVAKWDRNSLLYIPHISKIIIITIFLSYFFYRLYLLPRRKKVKFSQFKIISFLKFVLISIVLDFVKLIAFINYKKNE